MVGSKRYYASDVVWLTGTLVVSILIGFFLFGVNLFAASWDLHFHDTFFVIPSWVVSSALYIFFLFVAFYFKTSRSELRTLLSFLVVLFCGVVIILLLTLFVAFSSFFLRGGWTIYPPLSALGKDELVQNSPGFPFVLFYLLIGIFQLLIGLFTLRCAVRLGEYQAGRRMGNR